MKNKISPQVNDHSPSSLDAEIFVPIDLDWRKKYYKRVLKKRAFAFLLDCIINYILLFVIDIIIICILMFTIHFLTGKSLDSIDLDDEKFEWIGLTTPFLVVVVVAFMESSKWKGSFGKRIMKIEVSDNYGNSISFWKSFWRNILKFLTFYSYLLIIPLIIQIFKYKKTNKLFHDQFSNTIIGERL